MNFRCLLIGHQPGWRLLHDDAVITRCLNCHKLIEYSYETWRKGNAETFRREYKEATKDNNQGRANALPMRKVHELDKKRLSKPQIRNNPRPTKSADDEILRRIWNER